MAEATFIVNNCGVIRVRLEPTEIFGGGTRSNPILILRFKLQLSPLPAAGKQPGDQARHYTLIRFGGKLSAHPNEELLTFEAPPMAEMSSLQAYEHQFELPVAIDTSRLKRIEELRGGKDPSLQFNLTGLIAMQDGRFERIQNASLALTIPRSHWIDHVLNRLAICDLRLLEIEFPSNARNEIQVAKERLQRAEQLYRTGDYAQVLTALRAAFLAIAECYGAKTADRNLFEKMLVNTHPEMRDKLRDAFDYLYRVFHAGPHEPIPKPETPIPVSRHDARFALVTAHAIFEYFSSEGWPGI